MRDAVVPSSAQPALNQIGGMHQIWMRFFNTLVEPPGPIQSITVTASPFAYTAGAPGTVYVSGGTVSGMTLTRYTSTIPTGVTAGAVAVANNDIVTVTYSGLPTMNFVPN